MASHEQQAKTLVEALPYIQKFTGKTIVVKYGGNAMISPELRQAVMSDIILLSLVGIRVVVVHGGGPEISDMLRRLGHASRFVDGLRYTDEETMEVVQSVLCGKVNKNLVAQINRLGGQAIGLCGMDGALFQAERLDEKYGLVGRITGVNPEPVENALMTGYIPVVSTVAQGMDAETAYNINADTAAARLAVSLGAEKLILLTDVRGFCATPRRGDDSIHSPRTGVRGPGTSSHDGTNLRGNDPQDGVLRGRHRSAAWSGSHILDGRIPTPFSLSCSATRASARCWKRRKRR
jgi:acetylglutamate kinase